MTRGIAVQPGTPQSDARLAAHGTEQQTVSRSERNPSEWPVSEERPTLPTPPPGADPAAFDAEGRVVSDTIPAPPPVPGDADDS